MLLFHYTGKKDFQESTLKIQMLMFGLAQTSHFGLWDIFPLPLSTFMEIGKHMQNHKIETNSEVIYEDGSI